MRLAGALVVCVGAGRVAEAKALPLLEVGARLVVVAPEATAALVQAASAGRLTWLRRSYRPGDLAGALLVFAATADPACNAQIVTDAAAQATICVRVDAAGDGSADLAAVVRRGPLVLTVSTSGMAPSLARRLRGELETAYGPEWGELVALYGELRRDEDVRVTLAGLDGDERARRWRALPVTDILDLLRAGDRSSAKRAAVRCLSSSSD